MRVRPSHEGRKATETSRVNRMLPVNGVHSSGQTRRRKRRKIRIGVRNGLWMSEKFSFFPPPSSKRDLVLLSRICTVSNYTFRKAPDDPRRAFLNRSYLCEGRFSSAGRFIKFDNLLRNFLITRPRERDGIITFLTSAILQNSALDEEFFNYSDTSKYWKRKLFVVLDYYFANVKHW